MMNPTPSFESTNNSNAASIPFDFSLQPNSSSHTLYYHLSNIREHVHRLYQVASTAHPLSEDQPPPEDNAVTEILAITDAINAYQLTMRPAIEQLNSEPIMGAERFVARIKEHAQFLARLGARKYAIRQVKEQLEKPQVKKGGLRRDPRFTEQRIESLVKEVGYYPPNAMLMQTDCLLGRYN
jgi:hypothetical protein